MSEKKEHQLHTVIGASGATGTAVLEELTQRNRKIRAVTHSSTIPGHETVQADVRDKNAVTKALVGSDFVYLCIGLPYNNKVWEKDWEVVMRNTIAGCIAAGAKLIFLDNIYMYAHPLPVPFDEDSRLGTTTRKGRVRAKIADLMLDAMKNKQLDGIIARSADFFGPKAVNSILHISFLDRMLAGKDPQFLTTPDKIHTYAYVPDNARAMVLFAENEDCYGQVWHLPVGAEISTRDLLAFYNKALNKSYKISVLPGFMKGMLSLFIPAIREVNEMLYQLEDDYVMSWDKFKTRFPDFETTPYETSVSETVHWFSEARENG